MTPRIDLSLLHLRAQSADAEGFHMPLKGSEVLALVAVVEAARAYSDAAERGKLTTELYGVLYDALHPFTEST